MVKGNPKCNGKWNGAGWINLAEKVGNLTSAIFTYNLSACRRPASFWAIAAITLMAVMVLIAAGATVTLCLYCKRKKRKVTRKETKKDIDPVDFEGNPVYGDYSLGSMEVEMVDRNMYYGGEGVAQIKDANPMYHADSD
jgi:hypothetical protein